MANRKPLILISNQTKKGLDKLKVHPRETYDDIIVRLLKVNKTYESQLR